MLYIFFIFFEHVVIFFLFYPIAHLCISFSVIFKCLQSTAPVACQSRIHPAPVTDKRITYIMYSNKILKIIIKKLKNYILHDMRISVPLPLEMENRQEIVIEDNAVCCFVQGDVKREVIRRKFCWYLFLYLFFTAIKQVLCAYAYHGEETK